jgi:iron-sulfur cluster repair protein YtfE (RIC family)
MLVPLRLQPAPEVNRGDVFQLLLECHERIRSFSALALKLARLREVSAEERADAAIRVLRYFTLALPKHVADEDLSLAPRLREAGLSSEALRALDEMMRQHQGIEALLATLVPVWGLLRVDPWRHDELAPQLAASEPLAALLEEHLRLEERALFPEARAVLSARAMEAIVAELRGRRGQDP